MKVYLPVDGKENMFHKLETFYSKGGMNFISGKNETRGMYISYRVVERSTTGGGYAMESFPMLGNPGEGKMLVLEMKRANKKIEEKFYEILRENDDEILEYFVTQEYDKIKEFFIT